MSRWNVIFTLFCVTVAGVIAGIGFASHQPGLAYVCLGLFAAVIAGNLLISRKKR